MFPERPNRLRASYAKTCKMNVLDLCSLAGELQVHSPSGALTPQEQPVLEVRMRSTCLLRALRFLLPVAILLVFMPGAPAQTPEVSGLYECTQATVHGKTVACKGAPLLLKSDGRFELRGWEGSYLVSGSWVELSDSLVKSRAKIAPGHKIVFRYYGKHGLVEMIYVRRLAEPGATSLG
jgi:hypothetical protein